MPCKGEIIDFKIISPLQGLFILLNIIDGLHPSLMYPALSGLAEMSYKDNCLLLLCQFFNVRNFYKGAFITLIDGIDHCQPDLFKRAYIFWHEKFKYRN